VRRQRNFDVDVDFDVDFDVCVDVEVTAVAKLSPFSGRRR